MILVNVKVIKANATFCPAAVKEAGQVSRHTLANWERAHDLEINNVRAMELDALQEAYWMKKQGHCALGRDAAVCERGGSNGEAFLMFQP